MDMDSFRHVNLGTTDTENSNPYEEFGPTVSKKRRIMEMDTTSSSDIVSLDVISTVPMVGAEVDDVQHQQSFPAIMVLSIAKCDIPNDVHNQAEMISSHSEDSQKMENMTEEKESKEVATKLSYTCQAPGCNEAFKSASEHDAHYNARHRHICAECKRSLKSQHLLDLHLMERHDSYFAILSQKKAMYLCLVESCTQQFNNPVERQAHCLNEHPFLKKYLQSTLTPVVKDTGVATMQLEIGSYSSQTQGNLSNPKSLVSKDMKTKATGKSGNKNTEEKKSTHITFGHNGVRFIPRQIFAMQKTKSSGPQCKNNSEMIIDLSDLQNTLE